MRSPRGRARPGGAALLALALTGVLAGGAVPAAGASADAERGGVGSLAALPPMGFNNWNATRCRASFTEDMIKRSADLLVRHGLREKGYTYVNLDDCWALPERDADGALVPDPERFPGGIAALADYVHARGLKFGIYTSAGTKTCNPKGFPGALGHERADAAQFASWGVDFLKYDNCHNQGVDARVRYTAMRDALRATGRPILLSVCEWGESEPWRWARGAGQMWRTTPDIKDTWASVTSIVDANRGLGAYAGPGGWNDPDMLEVGNGGMSAGEYRSHFSLWAMMAAPLLIGTDLRKASAQTLRVLGNEDVIAVDQDPLGRQADVVASGGGTTVFSRPLAGGDRAVLLFNENDSATRIAVTAREAGVRQPSGQVLKDLWTKRTRPLEGGTIAATVPAHGVVMYRVESGG